MVYTGNAADKCSPGIVNPASITSLTMWGDYINLDTEERRRFVSAAHEYLIDQVQYTPKIAIPAANTTANIKMDFNHPIRELLWVVQRNTMIDLHEYFNYSSLAITDVSLSPRTDNIISAKIQLDGQDRFERRTAPYFRLVQPYQRHTTTPVLSFIYVYSFALRPEDAQPSGSVNASRIYIFNLLFDMCDTQCTDPPRGNATATVYAVNHNVLRVIDGFGGLLFKV